MTRGTKILTTVLILVIGALSALSGILFARNTNLEGQLKTDSIAEPSIVSTPTPEVSPIGTGSTVETPTPTPTPTPASTSTPTTSTSATSATTTSPKPVAGTPGTYTVKAGDTMFSIASGLSIGWLDLAKANGMDENTANKIKIGQVLVVPKK